MISRQVRVEVYISTDDHNLDGTEDPNWAYEVMVPDDAITDMEAEMDEIIACYPDNPDCLWPVILPDPTPTQDELPPVEDEDEDHLDTDQDPVDIREDR